MKSSVVLLSAVLCAGFAFGQASKPATPSSPATATSPTTPSSAPNSNSSSTSPLKARGPESVTAQDPNRVVATIDGKQITAKEALDLLKPFPPEQRHQLEANLPMAVQQLYMRKQLAGEAAKLSLDQQSPYKEQIETARQNVLLQAYLKKLADSSGPAQDPKQFYDSHPGDFEQVKLSGIFVSFAPPGTPASSNANVRTEDQAKDKVSDIEKKLAAGGDFATLARTESDNKQSSASGGDLGTYSTSDPQLPKDIKDAITKLQPGQVSGPIRIPNGYVIIKVDSRTQVPFDKARANIVQRMENEKSQAALKQQMDKYKIQVQDPDFFASSSAPASNVPSLQRPSGSNTPGASSPSPKPPAQR
ncbi:MAG: peptidylprolyl isomerase [Acidobacteriaceae bacterium]|nr:peptidylprolyl isomerase [Acidobacteriaceae bacterium]